MMRSSLLICALMLLRLSASSQEQADPSRYNVVWDTPSTDSFGSMPLGNGDVGLNVWVEPNGDLLFYISKVDAFDAGHLLPKLGRIRFRTDPPLPVDTFRQTLLCEGTAAARVYDAKGRQVAVVDARGAIPVVQPGKHEVRFDCEFRGAVAPAAVVTFRTKGEGERIAATK